MDIVEELRTDREKGARRLDSEYKAGLMSLARRFCADPGDAEELVNRTFAEVVRGIDDYLEQSAFFGWMCQIMTNIHSMDYRKKMRQLETFPGDLPDIQDETSEGAVYRELDASLLRKAVEQLPSEQREAVVLHYFADMPVSKIARYLSIPTGTVLSRLHYARKALGAKLGVAAKKPAAKALVAVLALCGLTAIGAVASLAVVRVRSSPQATEQQADNGRDASALESQVDNGGDAAAEGSFWLPLASIDPLFSTPQTLTKETSMNTATCSVALGAATTALALASTAEASLPSLDSSQFEYKFEMDALPTTEDRDSSGAVDFTSSSADSWLSLSNGAMAMNMTSGGQYLMSAAARGTAGDAWLDLGATSATGGSGYSIETLLRIDSQVSGTKYALNLQAGTSDTSMYNASLNFNTTGVYWGDTIVTNIDTTVWHTFRIVREGSGEENKFSVYVDGLLMKSGLGNGLSADINRIILGSPGAANYKGKATVAYLRFTKGAYAPPAAPAGKAAKKWSGEFPVQYEMTANDARFVGPTAGGTDWTGTVGSSATVTQTGFLSATAQGANAWWRATDSVWSAHVGPDTAYTVEFRLKVKGRWSGTEGGRDLAFQFWAGNPRNAAIFYVGASHVYWEPSGIGTITSLCDTINTGDWHTYRLAYSGASQSSQPYAYTLWLDDAVVATAPKASTTHFAEASGNNNFLRFGIVSSTTMGGSFDVDYVRWTTDGAWDYKGPPEAFTIVVR